MTSTVLNSWKEIAAYLHSSVRTVQRWEDELGLPIHRPHNRRGPAVAFTTELDQWLRRRTFEHGFSPVAFAVNGGRNVEGSGLVSQPDPASPVVKASVLNSRKEIAAYLHCSSQTVQKWRLKFGLPVHQPYGCRGPIRAFTKELDEWLRQRPRQGKAKVADLAATALLDDAYLEMASELEEVRRRLAMHVSRRNGAPSLMVKIRDLVRELSRAMDDKENPEECYDGSVQQQEMKLRVAIAPTDETSNDRAIAGFGRSYWVPSVAASTEDGPTFSPRSSTSEKVRENGAQFLRIGLNFAFTMIRCAKQIGPTERRHAAIEAAWKTYRAMVRIRARLSQYTTDGESTAGLKKLRLALQEFGSNDEINKPEPFYYFESSEGG